MQSGDFKDVLIEKCKRLMVSEVHGIHFFSDTCIKTLDKYNAISLLRYLSFLFSWSNYSILKALIRFNTTAIELLDEFDSLLDCYYNISSYPVPNFSLEMIPSETSEYTILAIRCNRELWDCNLQYVLDIQSSIVEKCEVTPYCLQLLAVESNPTIFYWTIPKCVVELIRTNLLRYSKNLYTQGILEVLVHSTEDSTHFKQLLATGPLGIRTKEEFEVILS